MDKTATYSVIILLTTCSIALFARLTFPEILPVLDAMRVIFYLILAVSIIAVLRNVVGLVTYGVFGPAIISLGLTRIGNIYWGLIAFFSIIGIGIVTRFLLEPLKLQMTHRLAIVVIAVASAMGFLIYVGFNFGNAALTYSDFLPILISSWIAERFMRDRSEIGWKASSQHLAYTLVAALASFLLISERTITNYFIYTPEMWILPVAFNILLGAKVQVRFTELFRFRKLAKSNSDGGGGYSQVLTLNLRNRHYIEEYNPRTIYPKITKLGIKETLQRTGIPVPKTLVTFERHADLKNLERILNDLPDGVGFVIKPNSSFGGRGITVIKQRNGPYWEKVDGELLTISNIIENMRMAMDGEYSGKWLPDKVFMEELLTAHAEIAKLSCVGLPDIRVIVLRGVPIMAMTRLPTKKSRGKANLHQGAIGAGIDLKTGRITNAVIANERNPLTFHPDTGVKLIDQQIPLFDEILRMAVTAQKETELGYAGVDVVIDKYRGPLIMEVNKRPGLEIQNANHKPLLERLRAVEMFLENKGEISVEEGIKIMDLLESKNWKLTEKDVLSFKGRIE